MPLYAAYTLLFSDAGLDTARISVLFLVWSFTGLALEVPTGAISDRFGPRTALTAGGLLRAAGYSLWILAPGFTGFATGFVLWGASGALESGSFQSLLYSALDRHGAAERYPGALGRARAVAGAVEVVATLAAAPLLVLGGTTLVGWVSVGVSVAGSLVAAGFPRTALSGPPRPEEEEEEGKVGYLDLLRGGIREVWKERPVRRLVLVSAVVTGLTAVDEYVPLLARSVSVPEAWIPVVLAGLALAASAGGALAGVASRARPAIIGIALVVVTGALVAMAVTGHPALLAVLLGWYVTVNLAIVLADARLQAAVSGPARATVTSVAALGSELAAILVVASVAILAVPR